MSQEVKGLDCDQQRGGVTEAVSGSLGGLGCGDTVFWGAGYGTKAEDLGPFCLCRWLGSPQGTPKSADVEPLRLVACMNVLSLLALLPSRHRWGLRSYPGRSCPAQ